MVVSGARLLGRYVVGERLGTGGLGEVYLAHVDGARGFRKRVVIKQVRSELAARPEVATLLRAEAEVVQRLAHGNIVQVLDYGVDRETPYLVMEHVDGVSLAELVDDLRGRAAKLGVAAALFVVESVCAALAHAHAARDAEDRALGLVHRDVTPGNILLSRDGVVKLTDFGIASVMADASVPGTGTPGYAAPEQLAGAAIDGRADIHGLGVVLAELLACCGEVAPELHAIAAQAAAVEVRERFADAHTLAARLETWRASQNIARAPAEVAACVRDLQRRRGVMAGQVGAALDERVRAPQTIAVVARRGSRRRGPVLALGGMVLAGALWWGMPVVQHEPAHEVVTNRMPASIAREAVTPDVVEVRTPPVNEVATNAASSDIITREPAREVVRPRKQASGRLRVNLVPWAEASVDGRALGRTPIDVALAPGSHRLLLVNPELGQRRSRDITIARGADTQIVDW